MEFVQEDRKEDQYSSDNREEEEGHHDQEEEEEVDEQQHKMIDNNNNNKNNNLQFMDYLSLKSSSSTCSQSEEAGISNEHLSTSTNHGGVWLCGGGGGGEGGGGWTVEREHMFDKVVTPSDVGKLNRLVIPKQHAEKYFPLNSAANEKGLLLNFEDRNGKSWRFRYSYWNSSQSYVMTKGWSRFVKEKKLDAGDIVSFERGVGDSGKGRLYIDWRRRPPHHYYHHLHHHAMPNHTSLFPTDHHHHHQLQHLSPYPQPVRWGGGVGSGGVIYPLPSPVSVPMPPRQHENLQYNYDIQYPYHHHQHPRHHHPHQISGIHEYNMNNYQVGISGNLVSPMVIESMPASAAAVAALAGRQVYHGANTQATPSKRLRLFGVNMEYIPKEEDHEESADITNMASLLIPSSSSSVSYPHHHQVRLPINNKSSHPLPITNTNPAEFSHKGKSSNSLSFDLDP